MKWSAKARTLGRKGKSYVQLQISCSTEGHSYRIPEKHRPIRNHHVYRKAQVAKRRTWLLAFVPAIAGGAL